MALFNKRQTPTEPTQVGAIAASGQTYRVASYADATHLSLLRQQWQKEAYAVYDQEGHLFYATNYVGSALSRIRLTAAVRPKEDGDPSRPVTITTGPIYKAVKSIASGQGGQQAILRQVGKNIFLAGECWVVAETLPDGSVDWFAASNEELEVTGGTHFSRRKLPGAQPRRLPDDALKIRLWKEHPRFSELADAGTRSCMTLLTKIITLNKAEQAVARSRMAGSGILALPNELVPPAWQNQATTGDAMESNPLWQALAESMTAPLKDEGHPSAVVPLLLVGPGEVIKNIKYESMERTFDSRAAQLSIQNAINQIANTLELPKEILLGTGEVTHFTAWAIREDVFQAHIQPLVELICEGLTRTFMKQALDQLSPVELAKVLEDAGAESIDDIVIWYDASQLIIRPDKGDKAIALHDRLVISDEELRHQSGIGEEAAPEEEERAKRIGIKMADPGMALTGEPTEAPEPPAPGQGQPPRGKGGNGPLP